MVVSLHRHHLVELSHLHSLIADGSIDTFIADCVVLPPVEGLCVAEGAWRAAQVLRRHVPALLGLLLGLVLQLGLLECGAWRSNFPIIDRLARVEVLNQLVHLGNPFVIFLKAAYLAVEQTVLFVAHLKMLLQAFDVGAQILVLVGQLRVEVLLEVQVTLHVVHFAVPEVQLVSLLTVVLLHESDAASDIPLLTIFVLHVILEGLHSILQSLLVRIEGRAERFGPLALFSRSDLL